jgi:hypothetical protein
MRPPGEIRGALFSAAQAFVKSLPDGRHGATVRELAACANVGYNAALETIRNMKRAGDLEIAGELEVPYRNRPVAEYAPRDRSRPSAGAGYVDLGHLLAVWK